MCKNQNIQIFTTKFSFFFNILHFNIFHFDIFRFDLFRFETDDTLGLMPSFYELLVLSMGFASQVGHSIRY